MLSPNTFPVFLHPFALSSAIQRWMPCSSLCRATHLTYYMYASVFRGLKKLCYIQVICRQVQLCLPRHSRNNSLKCIFWSGVELLCVSILFVENSLKKIKAEICQKRKRKKQLIWRADEKNFIKSIEFLNCCCTFCSIMYIIMKTINDTVTQSIDFHSVNRRLEQNQSVLLRHDNYYCVSRRLIKARSILIPYHFSQSTSYL